MAPRQEEHKLRLIKRDLLRSRRIDTTSQGERSEVTLTVDSQADGFFGAGVEVTVLCQASVVSGVHAVDLGDGVMGSGVDLGVVVKPDVLTCRVGLGLTQ